MRSPVPGSATVRRVERRRDGTAAATRPDAEGHVRSRRRGRPVSRGATRAPRPGAALLGLRALYFVLEGALAVERAVAGSITVR